MGNRLSCCMIGRNEEANIERCLRSICGIADEIIFVDTGSMDHTVEIAQRYGATVIHEQWKNDFSAHRNTSLEHASGEWIIFLDCDEELSQKSRDELKKVIDESSYEAVFVFVANLLDNCPEMTFSSIRLFRNSESYRFRGQIHEQIIYSIIENAGRDKIGQADIYINHYGYNPSSNNIKAKIRRNLEILNSYEEDKRDGFFYYNLGTEYHRSGCREKALESFNKSLGLTSPGHGYGPILVKKTITVLMELKKYNDALQKLSYYKTVYKDYKDLFYMEAQCHMRCGRYSRAKQLLEKYSSMPQPPYFYQSETFIKQPALEELVKNLEKLSILNSGLDLSVCIIARDESANIESTVISVNEIAKEVIVVDTGSSDNTCDIAEQLGARVHRCEWQNDFSKARNLALERASGKWILIIDADEILPDDSRAAIADLLYTTGYDGLKLKIYTFLDRSYSLNNCHISSSCRLFRNNGSRFTGKVQESIEASIQQSNGKISFADIGIHHLHHIKAPEYIKTKENNIIDTIKNADEQDTLKKVSKLAFVFFFNGSYEEAAASFKYCLDNEQAAPDIFYYYSLTLINAGRLKEADELLMSGINLYSDYTDLLYLHGIVAVLSANLQTSENQFRRCIEMGEASWKKYTVSPGSGSFRAVKSLAMCCLSTGRTYSALRLFIQLAHNTESIEDGIEGITQIFIKKKMLHGLHRFLAKHALLCSETALVVSKVCARMKLFKESLEYLRLEPNIMPQALVGRRDMLKTLQGYDMLISCFAGEIGLEGLLH